MKTISVVSPYQPRPWAAGVHESMTRARFSVIVAHRGAGKTYLAAHALADAAMRDTSGKGRYLFVSPFLKQARDVAWEYLKSATNMVPSVQYQESLLQVRLPNGAWICLYGADNPDALRGMHPHGVVMDEVADMKPMVWGEIVSPMLSSHNAWAVFIGTPKGINLFSDLYYKGLKTSGWYAGLFDVFSTGVLGKEEIEIQRSLKTERQFAQEMLCDFNAGSDRTLITLDAAKAAAGRHIKAPDYQYAARVLGVDSARYGDDRTAIVRRQGLVMFPPIVRKDLDTGEVIARVVRECEEWNPHAVFVDIGGNPGVYDGLKHFRWPVHGVDFGSKPVDPRFQNKRAEMWFAMRDWIKSGAAIPDDQAILADLCAPEYDYRNSRGRCSLESKEDMRSRGMPSPDIADALAVTFAFPIGPVAVTQDYDAMVGKVLIDA